jgi:hypothetical protein
MYLIVITVIPLGLFNAGEYIHSKGLKFGIYSSAGFKTCQAFPASLGLEEVKIIYIVMVENFVQSFVLKY